MLAQALQNGLSRLHALIYGVRWVQVLVLRLCPTCVPESVVLEKPIVILDVAVSKHGEPSPFGAHKGSTRQAAMRQACSRHGSARPSSMRAQTFKASPPGRPDTPSMPFSSAAGSEGSRQVRIAARWERAVEVPAEEGDSKHAREAQSIIQIFNERPCKLTYSSLTPAEMQQRLAERTPQWSEPRSHSSGCQPCELHFDAEGPFASHTTPESA
eukprot:2433604-Prymnesium_polylepis.1